MMDFILWYVATFMSVLGVTYFYIKIINPKKISFILILFIFIGALIGSFIKYKNLTYLSILSYFFIYPFIFYIVSKDNLKKLFYYAIIIWIYGALFDFLIMIIISLANMIIPFNMESEWFKIIPSMLALIFFVISSYISALRRFTNKVFNLLCNIKHFDFILIVFFIFIVVGDIFTAFNVENFLLSLLVCAIIILMVCLLILIVHIKSVDYEFNILVKTLKVNNEYYTNINDEYSIFKHNLTAKLLSVESVSNKKARVLINELIQEYNRDTDYHKIILDLPYGLDGVINQKLNDYKDKLEIKISNNLEHDIFDILTPKRYNVLVEKLSLFLDNAIEASVNSKDKILIINLFEENDMLMIDIKNTFSGVIDIDNIGKKHYSSKGKKRGLGLYSMLRNNEVSVNVKIVNNYFVGEIIAKFNDK